MSITYWASDSDNGHVSAWSPFVAGEMWVSQSRVNSTDESQAHCSCSYIPMKPIITISLLTCDIRWARRCVIFRDAGAFNNGWALHNDSSFGVF